MLEFFRFLTGGFRAENPERVYAFQVAKLYEDQLRWSYRDTTSFIERDFQRVQKNGYQPEMIRPTLIATRGLEYMRQSGSLAGYVYVPRDSFLDVQMVDFIPITAGASDCYFMQVASNTEQGRKHRRNREASPWLQQFVFIIQTLTASGVEISEQELSSRIRTGMASVEPICQLE